MTNAEARFNNSLRPRKPEGSLGRTAQDVHLDSHTAPELCFCYIHRILYLSIDIYMCLQVCVYVCTGICIGLPVHTGVSENMQVH